MRAGHIDKEERKSSLRGAGREEKKETAAWQTAYWRGMVLGTHATCGYRISRTDRALEPQLACHGRKLCTWPHTCTSTCSDGPITAPRWPVFRSGF